MNEVSASQEITKANELDKRQKDNPYFPQLHR